METKRLIFVILKKESMVARDLYEEVKEIGQHVIHEDRIRGFRSFVKIINSFPEIDSQRNRENRMVYKVHKA